jgi:hypothetical protein
MSRMKKLTQAERAERDEKRERQAARRTAVESTDSVARPKRIPTVGTCAYCAAENVALTIEHVFPESWYPDEHFPSKMLTVPACSPCNAAYDQVEKKLFLPLAVSLPDDPRTASIVERALRSAEPGAGKSPRDIKHRQARGESFLRRTSIVMPGEPVNAMWTPMGRPLVDFVTEGGLHVQGTPAVRYGWENLEAIAVKFLRGTYFERAGVPLGSDAPCWARAFEERDPSPVIEQWRRIPTCRVRGEFPFWVALATDGGGRRAGAFLFSGTISPFSLQIFLRLPASDRHGRGRIEMPGGEGRRPPCAASSRTRSAARGGRARARGGEQRSTGDRHGEQRREGGLPDRREAIRLQRSSE